MSNASLKIIPLGGVGEIGKNSTVIEFENDIIVVDLGLKFPDPSLYGIDLIIPDFSYLRENQKKIRAVLITHGHEDHIGAIIYFLREFKVPIYATKLTLGLIKNKFKEANLALDHLLIEIKPRDRVTIGQFRVEFIHINHSIAGCVALAIQTALGTVIHTGDIKIDQNPVDDAFFDYYTFARYGEEGVLLLLSDSTNAGRPGYTGSESITGKKITEIVSQAKGRLILASFASNIHRIQQIIEAVISHGRKFALSGLSMIKNVELARNLGYLQFRDEDMFPLNELKFYDDTKVAIITTGSQGEPMSALTRIANGKHNQIKVLPGDTVIISASIIPGNERAVGDIINKLLLLGAQVEFNTGNGIHVSGHASQEELKTIINLTKPRFFMPVHGEYRHLLSHAQVAEFANIPAENIMISMNGEIIIVDEKSIRKKGNVPVNNIYVDGKMIGDIGATVLKERAQLAENGIILVILIMNHDWLLIEPARFLMKGFIYSKTADQMIHEAQEAVEKVLIKWRQGAKKKGLESRLISSLKKFFQSRTGRSPFVEIELVFVDY